MKELFPGFETRWLPGVNGACIHARIGGQGPPLLLLHGFPQTHVMWHRIALQLASHFTLVCADLRGQGGSTSPAADEPAFTKRAMAADMVAAMASLGHECFSAVGHDRGARVLHRLALDHPTTLARVAFLDITPTLHRFAKVDAAMAQKAYHWFFLTQPGGLPERLIGGDTAFFLRHTLNSWAATPEFWHPDAFDAYLANLSDPRCLAAACADYRANATLDLADDATSAADGQTVSCPALILWGESPQSRGQAMLEIWRPFAPQITGTSIDAGHFLAEEMPNITAAALLAFLAPLCAAHQRTT
jgi:haloacetate dehalogenase